MFFHPDDVRWFKPVKIWTKYGLNGQIDEPLGTKGLFLNALSMDSSSITTLYA